MNHSSFLLSFVFSTFNLVGFHVRSLYTLQKFLILMLVFILSACMASTIPLYLPPSERPIAMAEQPWIKGNFLAIAYHDVEDDDPDQRFVSVRSDQLVEQLNWLHENGYKAVSVDDILAAKAGRKELPDKAVLLSFDDGYSSFYTRVYPILKAYKWPAVFAPVGVWISPPANQKVDFGGLMVEREKFATWAQIAEMSRSGLVEIAAHTDRSHYGLVANPQGTLQPAAAAHAYNPKTKKYETDAEFKARMRTDVTAISNRIRQATGKSPRVWIWPYGAESGVTLQITAENGYKMALVLDGGLGSTDQLMSSRRIMPVNSPELANFTRNDMINEAEEPQLMRVMHIDLDYVYDPDPAQTERNLGVLVQRVYDMNVSTVFLQAYADPTGDGLVRSVYFPNRHLPVRMDLFNRVAWQLRNRANVAIYAWMPVLSLDLDPSFDRVMQVNSKQEGAARSIDPNHYRRLSPFDARARKQIGEIYEDLAKHAIFDGILFHDDALLGDYEDASDSALKAYSKAGFGSIASMHQNATEMQRWARFKSKVLIDFTHELTRKVRAIRGPQIKTARNIYAMPIMKPESEIWYAQNLDDFLSAYDWVAPMAMPRMENVPRAQELAWLDRMVDIIASRKGALDKTVFELQALNWPSQTGTVAKPIATKIIASWMKRLQLRGARHFGYYPDNFVTNHPNLDEIRAALAIAWYPFKEK